MTCPNDVLGSRPSWADVSNADIKLIGLHLRRAGVLTRPDENHNRTDTDVNYLKKRSSSGKRDIPVSNYAADVIEKLRRFNGNKKYILNSTGDKPIPTNLFNETLKRYCREAGVRAFSSHKARFFVATSLFEVGLSDFQISRYLGHSDTATSHIYDRRSKEIKVDPSILETCLGNLMSS